MIASLGDVDTVAGVGIKSGSEAVTLSYRLRMGTILCQKRREGKENKTMHITSKIAIITHLQEACYILHGILDRSPEEIHALALIGQALGHIKDIEAEEGE